MLRLHAVTASQAGGGFLILKHQFVWLGLKRTFVEATGDKERCVVEWLLLQAHKVDRQAAHQYSGLRGFSNAGVNSVCADPRWHDYYLTACGFQALVDVVVELVEQANIDRFKEVAFFAGAQFTR
jgi:hypothetical protein